jgi:6-phosphogluconolactonase
METRVYKDSGEVAFEAAKLIAAMAREAVSERGQFSMAVSGGKTPWKMLRALGKENVPWESVHVFQVDERVAPPGHYDRNLPLLIESLLLNAPLKEDQIHAMPVEMDDLDSAANNYAATLSTIAGKPPVLDLVILGLGKDGHTASLIPEDPLLKVDEQDVGISGFYKGRIRMTFTYPILNRSRKILWIVTGAEKSLILKRLQLGDDSIPAGRICRDSTIILTDQNAVGDKIVK